MAKQLPPKSKRRQNSMDFINAKGVQYTSNTTGINLLTVHETDADRTRTNVDCSNTSRFGQRTDKGRELLESMRDRTGVSGIIPSGIITSKTDRFLTGLQDGGGYEPRERDLSPLTSNDSYMWQMSKDTDAPLKFTKRQTKRDVSPNRLEISTTPLNAMNASNFLTSDVSPTRTPDVLEDIHEIPAPIPKLHRRVQSLQTTPVNRIMSLSNIIDSPKVSFRNDLPDPLISPSSNASAAAQCLICFDHPPDAVFMDCGHGGNIVVSVRC